jgi:hypothetical protein
MVEAFISLVPPLVAVPLIFVVAGGWGFLQVALNRMILGTRLSWISFAIAVLFMVFGCGATIFMLIPALSFSYNYIITNWAIEESAPQTPPEETPITDTGVTPELTSSNWYFWLVPLIVLVAVLALWITIRRKRNRRAAAIANATVDEMESSLFEPEPIEPSIHPVSFPQPNRWGQVNFQSAWIRFDDLGDCQK